MSKELDNKKDDEADLFARCTLMPKEMFIKYFNLFYKDNLSLHQIAVELGKTFKVETTWAAIRITELRLHNRITLDKLSQLINNMDDISKYQDKTY